MPEIRFESCRLCDTSKELRLSHIIPSFVVKWIKDTSATGFLRHATNPNVRKQDGRKEYLLCGDCELIFSKFEQRFSSLFFYPYVNDGLDEEGNYKIGMLPIQYDDWLLKFVLSVQWRSLIYNSDEIDKFEGRKKKELEKVILHWKKFFLGLDSNSGPWETYLIPLCSLADAEGKFPENLHPKTNFYLLRAMDSTIVFSERTLGIYSKLGPIALYTSVLPKSVPGMSDLRIKMKGNFDFVYQLANKAIADFVFFNRPREAMEVHNLSESSKALINKSYAKNPERVINSKTAIAHLADIKFIQKNSK